MSKTVLTLDEINLLKNSEELKNTELYGNLYQVIYSLQNPKAVSLEDLPDLNNKAIGALTHNKKTLIDTIIKEWYAERVSEEDPNKKVRCGLCNTPNKYLYYIRNRRNGCLLNVGSHCITKFPNIEGFTEQKQQLKQIHKNHKIIARRNEFYDRFPNCETIISNAEDYFSTLPILLPYDLYTKLDEIIKRMRLIYTKYVNEGKKPFNSQLDSFELFNLAINQFYRIKNQSDEMVSSNKNDPLICKRREIDWLISQNKQHILSQIAENSGFYNLSTLRHITSVEFISDYIGDIFGRNQSQLYNFMSLKNGLLYIAFNKHGYHPQIVFSMSLKDFMQSIASYCIYDSSFTYSLNDFTQYMKILNTRSNLESVINYISDFVYKFNCILLFNEQNNSIWLCRRGDKSIRIFRPYDFLTSYSKHINESDESIKVFIFSIIKGGNTVKWITPELQAKQGIDERVNKLYKEQFLDVRERFLQYNKNTYVEITVYKIVKIQSGHIVIDFNHPEYVKISRRQIRVSDNTLKYIEYALYVTSECLMPQYKQGTIFLVQNTKSIKNGNTIFYVNVSNRLTIKQCTTTKEFESIFQHIDIHKRDIVSCGRVIDSFVLNFKEE